MDCENNNNEKVTEKELKEVGLFSAASSESSENLYILGIRIV